MDVRFKLAQHFTEGGTKPAIAFVVNGGKKALYEVLQCVRMVGAVRGASKNRFKKKKKKKKKKTVDPWL